MEKDFKKAGFTLAEVLITLAIIGVVAALTIPSVIRNYRAMQYETSLKKAYSDLSKAINLMRYDTGIEITKDNIGNQQFRTLFKKYFHVIKDCGVRACYDEAKPPYRNYSNTASAHYPYFDDGNFITKDGMTIFVENPGSLDTMISVDINGYLKAPNRWGYDLFTFVITKDSTLKPMGTPGLVITTYSGTRECSETSTDPKNGLACTYRAIMEKDYFKNLGK